MSYRKIEVNGMIYEYTVGKQNIKIKGVGAFPKEGNSYVIEETCECCGETISELSGEIGNISLAVTPKHIRKLILNNA